MDISKKDDFSNDEQPEHHEGREDKDFEGTLKDNEEKKDTEQKEEEEVGESKETKEQLPLQTPIPPFTQEEKIENRYILFMIYNQFAPIDRDDVFDLIDQLNKIQTPPEKTRIDMVVLSNGGYPHPAYQMMNIIRSRCKKLKAVVPLFAKSAATLMTLAADEIIMGAQSEIGPLDMQMEHPLIEKLQISALEGYYPFLQLYGKFVTDFFPLAMKMSQGITQSTLIKKEDAVDIAMNTAMSYLVPIVQQINPTVVNMCYRALTTGEQYAYNFLYRYMFKDKPERERSVIASQTAHTLVWNFQNHGQVIDRIDAKNLNLYVGYAESYDLFDMLYVITKEMLNILGTSGMERAIRVVSMEQIKRLLNVDSYLGYITFIVYKAYSMVEPLRQSLQNVNDVQKVSLAIRQFLSQALAALPPMPETEKNDIAQVSLELLEDIFLKNFKDENAIYSVAFNRIRKEKAFSRPVSEVIAGRIVEAVKELTQTIEIEIDTTPPEVVSKYILQILAFLLVYNIRF